MPLCAGQRRLDQSSRESQATPTLNSEEVARRTTVKRAGILTLVFAVVLSACEGDSDITVDELVGTWITDEPAYVQFNGDGTYSISFTIEGLANSPVEQGEYTLEGTLFTLISSEESGACVAGDRGRYEIEVLDQGPSGEDRMRHVLVEDECSIRASTGDVVLERVP